MADRATTPRPETSVAARSQFAMTALAILTLMSSWAIFLYLGFGSLLPSEQAVKPAPNDSLDGRADEKKQPGTKPGSVAKYADEEKSFVLEFQRIELLARLATARSAMKFCRTDGGRFHERETALRSNDVGRRLAMPETARKVKYLFNFPSPPDFVEIEQQLKDIESSVPSRSIENFNQDVQVLRHIEFSLDKSIRQYAVAEAALDQLLAENTAIQAITLQAAIERFELSDSAAVDQRVADRINKLRLAQSAQIQAETQRREKLEARLEAAKLQHDAVSQQSRASSEASRQSVLETKQNVNAKRSDAITRMRAAYDPSKSLLLPFTTPGYRQPQSSSSQLTMTAEKQPISYTGLLRMGALEDTEKGMTTLFHMAQPNNGFGKLNDRPLGDFPHNRTYSDINNAEVRTKLKRVQTFLRVHGEAMADAGLLSP